MLLPPSLVSLLSGVQHQATHNASGCSCSCCSNTMLLQILLELGESDGTLIMAGIYLLSITEEHNSRKPVHLWTQ